MIKVIKVSRPLTTWLCTQWRAKKRLLNFSNEAWVRGHKQKWIQTEMDSLSPTRKNSGPHRTSGNSVDLTSAVQRQAPIALNSLEHVVRTTNGVVYDYFSLVTIPSALDKTKPREQGLVFVTVTEKGQSSCRFPASMWCLPIKCLSVVCTFSTNQCLSLCQI